MSRGKNGIPDRWLDYKAVGKRLPGSRFIAFKVPLKLALTQKLNSSDVFGPWDLLDSLKKDKLELGLIIDLTFTKRYYTAEDVPETLQCVKIFTAGHEIPSDVNILSFKRAVHRFLQENTDNDKLIGVHCTHGLNRTGYLICRYLIDVDGLDPQKAIDLFNTSRGHAMERQNYLEDLLSGPKRSNKGIENSDLDPVQGSSTHRPTDSEPNFSDKKPHTHGQEPWRHRGRYRAPHPSASSSGLLPVPYGGRSESGPLLPPPGGTGLLPLPPFPPVRAPFCTYSWTAPNIRPRYQWQEPRAAPPSSLWVSDAAYDRRGRDYVSPPPNPGWTSDSDSYRGAQEKWDGPKMKTKRGNKYYNQPYEYHYHKM